MATVVRRTFRSSPHRDTHETWGAIVDLLTGSSNNAARTELQSISGIAASIISEQTPKDAPIIVTCEGPRTRIYCTYDDDAIDGTNGNENSLAYDPLKGAWNLSLPCNSDDLEWVNTALKGQSERITARDESQGASIKTEDSQANSGLVLDTEGFANL